MSQEEGVLQGMTGFPFLLTTVGGAEGTPDDIHALMVKLVLQLAVIIFAAKFMGELVERKLRQPAVLGELMAGIALGPYALGAIPIPGVGTLFPTPPPGSTLPVSPELYAIATLASVVLLFLSGLETDLATFLRYSVAGSLVGLGGVVFSFLLGAWLTVGAGLADGFMDPRALFMGAVSTATSVGITARILSDLRKMDSPEGVTILAGAVIDDVLGIVVLALVVGIARVHDVRGIHWNAVGFMALKALGFWVGAMAISMALARQVSSVLKWLRSRETMGAVSFGLALLLSGLAERAGLAMIIGAYIMGLALSRVDIAHELRERLAAVYSLLVPVFFCVMGMMVNLRAMGGVVVFGLVFTTVAALAKVGGCGLAAWLVGFNPRGCLRVGAGMMPRGEVALIVAGVGLATGAVGQDIFGVAVMMTLVTTLAAPPLLVSLMRGGPGLRAQGQTPQPESQPLSLTFALPEFAEFVLDRLLSSFAKEGFFVHHLDSGTGLYQVRKDDTVVTIHHHDDTLAFSSRPQDSELVRLFILEELATLREMLTKSPDPSSWEELQAKLALD